ALRKIDYTFDNADEAGDDGSEAAGQQRHQQHNQAFGVVPQYEFMNAESADENAAQPGSEFLICAGRFCARRRCVTIRLRVALRRWRIRGRRLIAGWIT